MFESMTDRKEAVKMKIAVAGTGYVGLSLSMLLAQHNEVHAVDIIPEKVEKLNGFESPIKDAEIEAFLAEAKTGKRALDFMATLDTDVAYTGVDYAVIATPTNYDSDKNFFDMLKIHCRRDRAGFGKVIGIRGKTADVTD